MGWDGEGNQPQLASVSEHLDGIPRKVFLEHPAIGIRSADGQKLPEKSQGVVAIVFRWVKTSGNHGHGPGVMSFGSTS